MTWRSSCTARVVMTAIALAALGTGARAQEAAISSGGSLVERQVLDQTIVARRDLDVYERPQRDFLFPLFWRPPESAGEVERGTEVHIVNVGETSLRWDRLVWLELDVGRDETVWFRIGPHQSAPGALWRDWDRPPPTSAGSTSDHEATTETEESR